jgi:hypothetical protein
MTPASILQHDGVSQPIIEWALDYGITPAIIIGRIERGIPIADAITLPMKVGHRGQRLPVEEQKRIRRPVDSWNGFSRRRPRPKLKHSTGINPLTVLTRLRRGWSRERALTEPVGKSLGRPANRQKPTPGVSPDFAPFEGTGAGSALQKSANITFSGIDR